MWFFISGDLVNDEIDIAIASLTITSEREEVVDFITPYFDQSGISIAGRKPVRPRSLFKFLEVLHVEVNIRIQFNLMSYFTLLEYRDLKNTRLIRIFISISYRFGWQHWQLL